MDNNKNVNNKYLLNIGYIFLRILLLIPVLGAIILTYILIFKKKTFENKAFINIFKIVTIVLSIIQVFLIVVLVTVPTEDVYYYMEGYKYEASQETSKVPMFNSKFYRFGNNDSTIRSNRAKELVEQAFSMNIDVLINSQKIENGSNIDDFIQERKYYLLEFEYDTEGYINAVILNIKN